MPSLPVSLRKLGIQAAVLVTMTLAFVEQAFAAATGTPVRAAAVGNVWNDINNWLATDTGKLVLKVGGALAILIVGWLLAKFISYLVFKVLCGTTLDDKIAAKLGLTMLMTKEAQASHTVERITARITYYILLLLVVVGALQYTGLTQVASPFQGLIDSIFQAVPNIAKAALILLVAYVAGTILRKVVSAGADKLRIDGKFAELTEGEESETKPFSHTLGSVIFWLIMVFGLAGALDALKIDALSGPVSNAIDRIVAALPALAKAGLIVFAGYILGRIARTVVSNLLSSVGLDKGIAKIKLDKVFEKHKASDVVGLIVFAFVMLQVIVAGLDELGLETLSGPLTDMTAQFWALVPSLFVAALIIIVGVVVGRLVRSIVENVLKSIGFDKLMEKLGFGELANRSEKLNEPSELLAFLVQVAIVLLATAQALETLGLATWSVYLNTFLGYVLKNVVVALLVVIVGFAVGNYVRDLIVGDGSDEGRQWMSVIARYTVLVLAFTMAIHQLDVAQTFVLILFSLLFGALCLATALAFGLGSRGVAEKIVNRQYDKAMAHMGGDAKKPSSPLGGLKAKPKADE